MSIATTMTTCSLGSEDEADFSAMYEDSSKEDRTVKQKTGIQTAFNNQPKKLNFKSSGQSSNWLVKAHPNIRKDKPPSHAAHKASSPEANEMSFI